LDNSSSDNSSSDNLSSAILEPAAPSVPVQECKTEIQECETAEVQECAKADSEEETTEPRVHRYMSFKWSSSDIRKSLQMFPDEANLAHRLSGFPLLMRIHEQIKGLSGRLVIQWLLSNPSGSYLFQTTMTEDSAGITIEGCECPAGFSSKQLQTVKPTEDFFLTKPLLLKEFEKTFCDCICEMHHPLLSSVRTLRGSCQCKSFYTLWES
jgi:hypothetical protein